MNSKPIPIFKLIVAILYFTASVEAGISGTKRVSVRVGAAPQSPPWFTLRNYVDFGKDAREGTRAKYPTWKFVAKPVPAPRSPPIAQRRSDPPDVQTAVEKIFSVNTAVQAVPLLIAAASWWYTLTTAVPLILVLGRSLWRKFRIRLPGRFFWFYAAAVAISVCSFAWFLSTPTVTSFLTILFARLRLDVPFFRLKGMVPTWAPHRFINQRHIPAHLTRFVMGDQYPY